MAVSLSLRTPLYLKQSVRRRGTLGKRRKGLGLFRLLREVEALAKTKRERKNELEYETDF
jgi:hypothetical protein